jgi:predicted phage terminase large subunit-like protein
MATLVPLPVRAAALLELRRRRRTPRVAAPLPPFNAWIAAARPEYRWDAPHFRLMHAALDEVTAGTLRRLVLSIAVRHGKTESVEAYAVARLVADPGLQILVGTYNQQQADLLSRVIRRHARAQGVVMSEDRDAAREWETAAGGGVRAVGAGAGVASVNAGLILIDDPIGSRDEAESQTHRDKVWDWLTNDILARCVPGTAVIVSHPRWHQDDPIGRLRDRQAARWRVIDLPGRAEPGDPLGRPEGSPLWPELRGEAWLDEKRDELGEYGFASLVQGRPRPREGGMFKWAWWQHLEAVPAAGPMLRYWDLAGTQPKGHGHDPDHTAGALLCRMGDLRTAVVDMARFRESIAQRDAHLEAVARADLAAYPGRVRWWIETEAGLAGDRTTQLVRRLQALGMAVSTEHPTGNKVHRAEPLASAVEAGNVLLCPGAWRDPFRAEAADFPNGAHDDQVDAAAGAFAKLAVPRPSVAFTPLTL